ncbi:MAG: LysR family transcriptional regulator [Sneathiella sp.]
MCVNAQMEDWDDYKFILALGRHGGLSAAARALHVNHSTVSRRIASAEERLGVRLFDRLPSGFIPTDEGMQAIDVAEKLENELHALNRHIAAKDKNLAGPLRVTTPQLIFQACVAEILADFSEQYPQIDITVRAANENLNLSKREADVAIRVGNSPDPTLYGRRIMKQKRGFYLSRRYLERLQGENKVISSDTVIHFVSFIWWGRAVPVRFKEKYPHSKVGIELDDMVAVLAAVKAGLGVGRMPCFLGDTDPDLIRMPDVDLMPTLDIWVLTHPDLKNIQRIRTFMTFTARKFEEKTRLFSGE